MSSKYFANLLCQLRSLLWFQCKSDSIFHNMYLPFFFGSTYITLTAQNSSKRSIASTCSSTPFSAIIVSHYTESKKLSTQLF